MSETTTLPAPPSTPNMPPPPPPSGMTHQATAQATATPRPTGVNSGQGQAPAPRRPVTFTPTMARAPSEPPGPTEPVAPRAPYPTVEAAIAAARQDQTTAKAPTGGDFLPMIEPANPMGIPPARRAGTVGDPDYKPDWDKGVTSSAYVPMLTVPVLARPSDTAAPAQSKGMTMTPAREMDPATARAALARIVADTKNWVRDFPHQVDGESAHVLAFFQGLADRHQARLDATHHGQMFNRDVIDGATHHPPTEQLDLIALLQETLAVFDIFRKMARDAGLNIAQTDQDIIGQVRAKVESRVRRPLPEGAPTQVGVIQRHAPGSAQMAPGQEPMPGPMIGQVKRPVNPEDGRPGNPRDSTEDYGLARPVHPAAFTP